MGASWVIKGVIIRGLELLAAVIPSKLDEMPTRCGHSLVQSNHDALRPAVLLKVSSLHDDQR